MKKLLVAFAIMTQCAVSLMADTLELRIVSDGQSYVTWDGNPRTFNVQIEGRLLTGDTDGLALWGVNLTSNVVDLCDSSSFLLTAPVSLSEFDRNEGLTNPPDVGGSGYSGTCDGGGGLWQVGGGQNTIGNTGPTLYPVGTVEEGVGNAAGWTVLAEGTIDIEEYTVLSLDTGYANTLNPGSGPDVYAVTDAPVIIVGDLLFESQPHDFPPDVNCDGIVNGLDIGVVTRGTNWGQTSPADPRADVNGDGSVNGLDIGAITVGTAWGVSTGMTSCP